MSQPQNLPLNSRSGLSFSWCREPGRVFHRFFNWQLAASGSVHNLRDDPASQTNLLVMPVIVSNFVTPNKFYLWQMGPKDRARITMTRPRVVRGRLNLQVGRRSTGAGCVI